LNGFVLARPGDVPSTARPERTSFSNSSKKFFNTE
jgi:hypothetical protein